MNTHVSQPDPALRVAGGLFLAGGLTFALGACSPPQEQWSAPPRRALEVIASHPTAWIWIHACFAAGVVLTILGFAAFALALAHAPRAALLAALARDAYLAGAVLWLANIAFRVTVQAAAAAELVRTGALPAAYAAGQQWVDTLFALYMALAYLAAAAVGWIVLRTAIAPRWSGWFAVAFGLTAGGVVGASVPALVHLPLMIVGSALLRRRGSQPSS
jgi:hypothetical protein